MKNKGLNYEKDRGINVPTCPLSRLSKKQQQMINKY